MPSRAEIERIKEAYCAGQAPARAARYSPINPAERYMLRRRERATLALLGRHGWTDLPSARILDLGCGRGHRLADWQGWGARAENLAGVDLMEEFVRDARNSYPKIGWTV